MDTKFDFDETASILGITADMVKILTKQMLSEKDDYLGAIRKAMDPLDYNALGNAAHKLKGPAINLRIQSIAQLAEKMENGARKLEDLDYQSLLASLEEEFRTLESAVS